MLEDLLQRLPYNAVTDFIDGQVARGLGEKIAFTDSDRSLSYGELQGRSCRFASALQKLGLRPEERLGLLLYDTVDFPVAFWGGVRAGIVVLPLNTLLNAEQYAYILGDSRTATVVASASLAKTLVPVLDRLPHLRTIILVGADPDDKAEFRGRDLHDFADLLARGQPEPFTAPTLSDEVAFWLYTSGSTGKPKGVVLSHQSHIWVVETRLAPGLDRHRYLIAAPLYHMNALALAKLASAAHATIVLLPQFFAPAYIAAIGKYRCTWLTAVPPMIAMMLRETAALAATDLSSVEFVRMGSAPVSAALMASLHEALPRASVTNAYGTTEAGPVVFGPHPKGLPQPELSVGYPHPLVSLRLVDGDNRDAGQGVLEMKCPALMLGYHNRPDVAPPLTPDGFYVTGDVFRRDADGFHYFVGRVDDMFVSGGENIYPADVERMLERHPDIAQAAVVPIDDDIKGQKPVAFVIKKSGRALDAEAVKRFALANAPAYQHPRFVWFVDELPLASSNKIDRTLLHGLAQERLAGTTVK